MDFGTFTEECWESEGEARWTRCRRRQEHINRFLSTLDGRSGRHHQRPNGIPIRISRFLTNAGSHHVLQQPSPTAIHQPSSAVNIIISEVFTLVRRPESCVAIRRGVGVTLSGSDERCAKPRRCRRYLWGTTSTHMQANAESRTKPTTWGVEEAFGRGTQEGDEARRINAD